MESLTIDQLQSLGFHIFYKKKKGETVFSSCCLNHTKSSWLQGELVGSFYSPPSFLDIVNQVAENATAREYSRIKEKLAKEMLD